MERLLLFVARVPGFTDPPSAPASGQASFDDLRAYVGFTDESAAALRTLHPVLSPHFPEIVDAFYDLVLRHPAARAAVDQGAEREPLARTLGGWLDSLCLGPHDERRCAVVAETGHGHLRVDLPPAIMCAGINRIRLRLHELFRQCLRDHEEPRFLAASAALDQLLDMDLAIMLESYRADLVDKIRQGERLATIGQFAASIGHELRTPLAVMDTSVFIVRERLGKAGVHDAHVDKHLDRISTDIRRASKTISDLLALARDEPLRPRTIELGPLLTRATDAAALPHGTSVAIRAPEGATLEGDPEQLLQVVTNLLTNAAQALDGVGHIWLEVSRGEQTTELRVRDDGPGVPPELRHRIFEPLFTTKPSGTGLGLSLCRRIARAHGGSLVLEPSARGATFLLSVPDRGREAARA